jgi:hypothetical protein
MSKFLITEEEKIRISALYESIFEINPKKLKLGDGGNSKPELKDDVLILQKKLIYLGCLKTKTGKPTGYFGSLTKEALKKFQTTGSCKTSEPKSVINKSTKPDIENGVLDKNSSLLFDGDKLHWLSSGKIVKSWDAESGLTIKNALSSQDIIPYLKSFIQSKEEWMKQKNAGPIPTGSYIVGPLETRTGEVPEIGAWEAFWLKISGQLTDDNQDFHVNTLKSRIGWGNHRLPITPQAGTNTYGRGSFYIHGGSLEGSHGCIDLTDSMSDFAKVFASWSSYNKKNKLPLKVEYKNENLGLMASTLVKIDRNEPVDLNRIDGINDNLA